MPVKKTTTRKTRTTRTRDELNDAFERLQEKHSSTPQDRTTANAARLHEQDVRASTRDLTVESATNAINNVSLTVTRTLAQVQEELGLKVQELENVKEAIVLEKTELERLHGVDVVASSIDALVQDYTTREQEFTRGRLEVLKAWQDEQNSHSRAVQERDETLARNRKREEDQYNYNQSQLRKKSMDEFQEEIRILRAAEAIKTDELLKNWNTRENALKAQEKEFQDYRTQVENFPNVLKTEVGKAEAIVGNRMKKEAENAAALLFKEYEADKKIMTFQVTSLQTDLVRKDAEIATLQSNLEKANSRVQEIAAKAFEATSGQQALDRISQIQANQNGGSQSRPKA